MNRTRDDQITVDTMFGRLSPSQAAQAAQARICPDPPGHARLYAESELTWRKSARQRAEDWATGCPWCPGAIPPAVTRSPLLRSYL